MTNTANSPLGQDRVLILIHGATLNGRMWDSVRRFLDPRYAILTPDLPGHGTNRGLRYTIPGAIQIVATAAQSVYPAPVVLVGDSLGAYTAMASAARLPAQQLQGLVLGGSTFDFKGAAVFPAVFRGALLGVLSRLFGEQRLIEKLMPKALARFGLSDEDARHIIEAGMSVHAFGQAVQAIRRVDFLASLSAIQQPALIVNGDEDKLCVL